METLSLFADMDNAAKRAAAPLAVRVRPETLDDIVGQAAAIGPGSWLRRAIESDTLTSVILYGPAGTGKTSIAHVIAHTTRAEFVEVSAVGGTVADLRREIQAAERRLLDLGKKTILFVDEIHRFNRSQQDALLHAVEDRIVVLVGATTENPFFEVNTALLSRSRVVELTALGDDEIRELVLRALTDERGLAGKYELAPDALDTIVLLSGGDGRAALSTLEAAAAMATLPDASEGGEGGEGGAGTPAGEGTSGVQAASHESAPADENVCLEAGGSNSGAGRGAAAGGGDTAGEPDSGADASVCATHLPQNLRGVISADLVRTAVPHRHLPYDKNKDMHYDVISAFIKSMRGSDPDAALYWLARMIDGGEDPKFIARRIFILAAEDIGNADPTALLVAEAAFKSAEVIGYPECQLILAQAATYMALAPKSNASCGIFAALAEVRRGPVRDVPDALRDRHRPGSDSYGEYLYPHNFPGGWVEQQYLPDGISRGAFYSPSERGWEAYRTDAIRRDRAERGAVAVDLPPNGGEGGESGAALGGAGVSPVQSIANAAHEQELKRKGIK